MRTRALALECIILEILFHARNEQKACDWSMRCHAASQLCAAEKAPGGTERLLPAVASSSAVFVTGEGNSGVQTRRSTHLKSGPTPVNTGQNPHADDQSAKQPDPNTFKHSDQLLAPSNSQKTTYLWSRFGCLGANQRVCLRAHNPRFVALNLRNEPFYV